MNQKLTVMPAKAGIPYRSGESIVLMLALPVDPSPNLPRPGVQRLPLPVALLLRVAIHLPHHARVSEADQRLVLWKVVEENSCDNLTRFG